MLRAICATIGGLAGGALGVLVGQPFDILLIPVGAFVGFKAAPRGRRMRS